MGNNFPMYNIISLEKAVFLSILHGYVILSSPLLPFSMWQT